MHRCIFGKNCDEKGTSPLPGLLKRLVEREILESFLGTNGLSGKIFQNKDLASSADLASELGSYRDAWRSRSLRQTADGRRQTADGRRQTADEEATNSRVRNASITLRSAVLLSQADLELLHSWTQQLIIHYGP